DACFAGLAPRPPRALRSRPGNRGRRRGALLTCRPRRAMSDALLEEAPDPADGVAPALIGAPSALLPAPELSDVDATIYAFRRNIVVAASAGTGKTHRLTGLYLLLTLGLTSMDQPDARTPAPPVTPERIIATTFSRAAALEISLRIERALA